MQTLAIIKPDAIASGKAGAILKHLQEAGFTLRAARLVRLTLPQAEAFYAVHKERPFFGDLTKFMSEGPVVVSVLEGANAIERYRELLGATNPEKAAPGTVRQLYGTNVERNAAHGSDAPETAAVEIAFFFNALELHPR